MQPYPAVLSIIVLVIGVFLYVRVAQKPKAFWPVLWSASILSSGVIIGLFTFLHEYLIAAPALAVPSQRLPVANDRLVLTHARVFVLLLIYMTIETIRGLFTLGSAQKLRWIVFYGILILLARIALRRPPQQNDRRSLPRILTASGLLYFSAYLLQGLVAEHVFGINRYDVQPGHPYGDYGIFGSSAYAMFPVFVVCAGAFIATSDSQGRWRVLAWITLAVSAIAAIYYDSRSAQFSLIFLLIGSTWSLGIRRTVAVALVFAVVLLGFTVLVWSETRDVAFLFSELSLSGDALWDSSVTPGAARDFYRSVTLPAALSTVQKNAITLLFGYGNRVSGFVVGEAVLAEYSKAGVAFRNMDPSRLQLEALPDFIVNFGLLGTLLLALALGLATYDVVRQRRSTTRALILAAFLSVVGWMFAINFLDVPLFYLAFMPNGPLLMLAKMTPDSGTRQSRRVLSQHAVYQAVHRPIAPCAASHR